MRLLFYIQLILASVLFVSTAAIGQTNQKHWQNTVNKMEVLFKRGAYSQAYNQAVKLEKHQIKNGAVLDLLPVTQALKAKYAEAKGKAMEAHEIMQEVPKNWKLSASKLDSNQQLVGNLLIADVWLTLSNSINALTYIEKSESFLSAKTDPTGIFNQQKRYLTLQANLLRHDYHKALILFDTIYAFQKELAKRNQEIYNPNSHSKEHKKLKRKEFKKRKMLEASLLVTQGEIYRKMGNLKTADSLFKILDSSIKSYVKKNQLPYARLQQNKAHILEDKGNYAKAAKEYKKARKKYASRIKTSVPNKFYTEIFEDEIRANQIAGKQAATQKAVNQYVREHLHRYGRKSTYFIQIKRIKNEDEIENRKYVKALKRLNRNIAGFQDQFPIGYPGRIPLLEQYQFLQLKSNNYALAAQVQQQTMDILDSLHGPSAPVFLEAALEKAKIQTYYTYNFEESDSLYNLAFNRVVYENMHPYHANYIPLLEAYATQLIEVDRFDSALVLINLSKEITKQKYGASSTAYARQLRLAADIHIIKGEFLEAEMILTDAVNTIKDDGAKETYAYYNTLQTLGEIQNINGKFEEAQTTLKQAMRIAKRLGLNEEGLAANSTLEMAQLFIETGRYKEAEELLKKNIELQTKKHGPNYYQLIDPYTALGNLYLINGDFVQAEKHVSKALKVTSINLSDTGRKYIANEVLLGDVYYSMGDYSRASGSYNSALTKNIQAFGETHILNGDILVKKARIMLATHSNTDSIVNILNNAAYIIQGAVGDNHPKYAAAIELKAEVLQQEEKFDEALALLERAQTVYKDVYGPNHLKTAENEVRVANLYYRKKEYERAEEEFKDALKTYKKVFGNQHPDYTATLSRLGRTYYAHGNFKKAMKTFDKTTSIYLYYIKQYFPSLTENEKTKYWNKIRTDFEIFNSLATVYHQENPKLLAKMYDYKLATKAILLSSSIKVKQQILASGDAELINLYNEWKVKREMLTLSLSLSFDEQDDMGIFPRELEKEISTLEKELGERSSAFAKSNQHQLYSWKDVRKTLKDNEAAIEIIRFNYYNNSFTDSVIYAALIVHPNSKKAPQLVEFADGNTLENKYFKYYRNVIKYKAKDKNSYTQFWKPIEDKLAGATTIYLSSDGVYNQLNPETFRKEDGTYLIDKYNFYNVSNTKDLVIRNDQDEQPHLANKAVMFGNPDFGPTSDSTLEANNTVGNKVSSVEPLPGAEEEVKTLSRLLNENKWNTKTYLTTKATENKVKEMNNPRVFHVATHGFFVEEESISSSDLNNPEEIPFDNPLLKSGLLFVGADELLEENNIYRFNRKEGVLTAYEAMNLSLDNTELVVLSACETGLGEVKSGEGVYGLQRSFLVAGAQNVIMTLFKVNDEVTQELMSSFYAEWLKTGNKRQAFINAKLKIKETYNSPIYWGSFVMIGLD